MDSETILKEVIPAGAYCYEITDGSVVKVCPFWRGHCISASPNREVEKATVQFKEDGYETKHEFEVDKYPLYDSNIDNKFPQYRIGECTLLHTSDLDNIGFGLLWDQCKCCGINMDETGPDDKDNK